MPGPSRVQNAQGIDVQSALGHHGPDDGARGHWLTERVGLDDLARGGVSCYGVSSRNGDCYGVCDLSRVGCALHQSGGKSCYPCSQQFGVCSVGGCSVCTGLIFAAGCTAGRIYKDVNIWLLEKNSERCLNPHVRMGWVSGFYTILVPGGTMLLFSKEINPFVLVHEWE